MVREGYFVVRRAETPVIVANAPVVGAEMSVHGAGTLVQSADGGGHDGWEAVGPVVASVAAGDPGRGRLVGEVWSMPVANRRGGFETRPYTRVIVVLVVCGLCSRTHAQAPEDVPAGPTLTEEQARSHFNTGRLAFSAGRFADALSEFQKSYELSQRPMLLYNIGVASDRLRRDREALAAFEQYLQQVPDAPERAEVEARIAVLRGVTATPMPAPAPAIPASTTATTSRSTTVVTEVVPAAVAESPVDTAVQPSHPTTGQWLALGGSGLVAVTGGVLVTVALMDKSTVEGVSDGGSLRDIEAAHDRVPMFSTLGAVMLGVGLAGVGAATAWIVLSSDDQAVEVQAGLGHVSVRGSF